MLDIGPKIAPLAAAADKGYDAAANRAAARKRGIARLPRSGRTPRRSRLSSPTDCIKAVPGASRPLGKLKRFKRVAMRCEKTVQNYASFVALALGLIWIKPVHTA